MIRESALGRNGSPSGSNRLLLLNNFFPSEIRQNFFAFSHKAVRVFVFKHIRSLAVRDSQAPPAFFSYRTPLARLTPLPILPCGFGLVNAIHIIFQDIADPGWKFPASVNLAVRKERKEIERGTAAEVGATSEKGTVIMMTENIEEVVLKAKNLTCAGSNEILLHKRNEPVFSGDLKRS